MRIRCLTQRFLSHFYAFKCKLSMKTILSIVLFLFSYTAFTQNTVAVTGIARDENGEPLPFATVYVRNSSNGTVTNAKGFFRLNVAPGPHEIVFQYIGYQQHIEKIKASGETLKLDVKLTPSDLQIGEVVITGEDPAYRIMREAIAKRDYYKNNTDNYSVDVYMKGFYKILKAPKKIMGKDVGDMGGVLDTSGSGVLYLSESVSKLYAQKKPARQKEVMISSKVSGSDNGFSFNRATYTDFNLYTEHVDIGRDILSPLADNAFNYYNFKYLGEYTDQNGFKIEKIQVRGKRSADPVFNGTLFIVDNWWNLASFDLYLNGSAIKQPAIDTMHIQQEFVFLDKPDKWRVISQLTTFHAGIFGIHIGGFFNSVFSNYEMNPAFPANLFGVETFKIENEANKRDTAYWNSIRPVPLTAEEARDYTKKDSISRVVNSKSYMDSLDHKDNKFKVMNLLGGYTWKNTYKKTTLNLPGAGAWIQFNTVQGWLLNFQPSYTHTTDQKIKSLKIEGDLNYGFSEEKLRGALRFERRFDRMYNKTLVLHAGILPQQFNGEAPIGVMLNEMYSLYTRLNYMKLYEKTFARAEWSQRLARGILISGGVEWNQRKLLKNNSSYSWHKGERQYSSNDPIPGDYPNGFFQTNEAFLIDLEAEFRVGETYSSYPGYREYSKSEWPELFLRYKKAISGVAGSDVNYDHISAEIRKEGIGFGLAGYTDASLSGGFFIQDKHTEFIDLQHFNGNQTLFAKPQHYLNSFFQLPYYMFSTNQPYLALHAQHHLQGWLLDKIPGVRKLNWKELFGFNMLYMKHFDADSTVLREAPYWEVNAGFENIGFGVFRILRVDLVNSFYGNKYDHFGVVLGLSL